MITGLSVWLSKNSLAPNRPKTANTRKLRNARNSPLAAARLVIDDVVAKYGRIDILVNNAGIQIRKWATEFPVEEFDKVINVNMRAYYIASRCAARYMQKQGGGSIVCISSGNSQCFTSQRSAYNISKAAVNGLVATLGVE